MRQRICVAVVSILVSAGLLVAGALPVSAEKGPPGPSELKAPRLPVPAGVAQPVPVAGPLKPDLTIPRFDLHVEGYNKCHILYLVIRNWGNAPLPDSAYAATAAGGGVKITLARVSGASTVPVKTVMLGEIDPGRLVQPAKSQVSLGNALQIALPQDEFVSSSGQVNFRVELDVENKVEEANETNNVRQETVHCN